ncbi:hypothetical protein H310_00679 [Aphanomyces invadans]|uniref:PH domain-containing protein n=1 Tax=Aphanomyces invadans TaxID=157072 RepID=A0A024UXF7_9STRA|nr:hypothetical protein H310_00679 [Aphanomyces invadans]ETW10358.1 hypothetical protein H310_00679 [Aphanomyces invadans]|eukprot:XP_008861769.1 hypothetical protein H310_00679 [Aphanomyces invadans]
MAARRPAAGTATGSEVDLTLTPFCTDDGSGHWILNDEISQLFMNEGQIHRKVSLVVVFELPGAGVALPSVTKKGLFIVKNPIKVDDDGDLTYLLVLRHVDLTVTPQWGTLALLLASHAIIVREGHVHSEGFRNLNFVTKLMDVSMVSGDASSIVSESAELNAQLLKRHMPKLTYVVVDVDKKDCGGNAFPAYFEKMLATHPQNDFATTSVLANFFTTRDCIGIKSTMFKVPNAPYTAAKVVGAATDGHAFYKPFFGRYLCCGILVHLLHAVVPPLSTNAWAALPFRDLLTDVSIAYWHELTDSAIGTYADWMHVKVMPYEPVKVDSAMVVDLTEIKMGIKQNEEDFHVIDHGQGDHSVFDEYGNLKKTKVAKDTSSSTLDVGILHFLKQKRGGLQRQASIAVVRGPAQDSEDSQLDVYFEKMRLYEVPVKYIQNQQREKMPLDSRTLEAKHAECVALATTALFPFMALSSHDDLIFTGEHSLDDAVQHVHVTLARLYHEFQTANAAASAAFCSKLVRYLHGVIVEKTHLDDSSTSSVSQSKLMLFLIAYRANVEALVSQYNFLAKGPAAQAVLTGFLQAVVPAHIQKAVVAAHRTFETQQMKLQDTIAHGKQTLVALNQSLAESNGIRMDCMRREIDGQRLVDERKAEQARMVESSIAEAEAQIARALREKDALFAKTVETTQATVATVEIIAKKPKEFSGYLFRQEGSGFLGKKWKQSFFVLKDGRFLCFKAKSYYEENRESMEPPLNVSGYTVLESRSHGNEFKLAPPTAGRTYCFRAPSDDDKELWVQKFNEASNF